MSRRWAKVVEWAYNLDARRPWPAMSDLEPIPALEEALGANPVAQLTWDSLPEVDRVRLTLFVRDAWTDWGRRRRASALARACASGPEGLAAWQANNGAVAAATWPDIGA